MPIDVMEINETLVNRLNLYTYPSLEAIREKVKHLPASSNTKKYKQIMAQDNLNDLFKKDI